MNHRGKIIVIWVIFLVGTLFHTQLGLMPLFHGLSVAESQAQSLAEISWVLWLMLGFFVLPMFAAIATAFTDTRRYRVIHFGLTVFYSVMNLLHVIADLVVQPIHWYQITLMIILFAIGLLLNIVAFQWMHLRLNNREVYNNF
jgi:hypothetical protein